LRPPEVRELKWRDPPLAAIDTPKDRLRLTLSPGSGLSRRAGDPPGRVWGLGDRGPNLKIKTAIKAYGLDVLKPLKDLEGAKVLPLPDFQPMLVELQVGPERVELVRQLPLRTGGEPMLGRPLPGGDSARMEPVFDVAGRPLEPSPRGCDPEGVAALADGSFWVSEEYGPSLMAVGADGVLRTRWVPEGVDLPGAEPVLPARALRRRLNRGFEGLTVSADEAWLYLVFQSALADAPQDSTLIWKLDARDGSLCGEFIYPFDAPDSFPRDLAAGEADLESLKVCELVWLAPERLLVLERITRDARLYVVDLTTPGPLAKTLAFTTDDHPSFAQDLEGATLLSDREVLLATDNDFGVEAAETRFYRLTWDAPL
jgi:hypothetical protein